MTTEISAYLRLMNWLSPSFPTGSFGYSHGLEYAFEAGLLPSRESFYDWLTALISGSCRNDAIICALAWETASNNDSLDALSELSLSMAGSRGRFTESLEQGKSFLKSVKLWDEKIELDDNLPLPIALGAIAQKTEIEKLQTVAAYLNSFVSALIQAALRLGRFGQDDGVYLLSKLEAFILETATHACTANIDDLGNMCIMGEISAMKHEELRSRIFIT